jgi:hypothetical protein
MRQKAKRENINGNDEDLSPLLYYPRRMGHAILTVRFQDRDMPHHYITPLSATQSALTLDTSKYI